MRKSDLLLLLASTFVLSSAHADGGLQGLEMDVMDAGESPAQATARIALPGAGASVDDGKPDSGELITGGTRGGAYGGEAAALDTAEPTGPASRAESVGEAGAETSDSIDLGAPDVSDGGGGAVDGNPGTIGIIEPGEVPIDDTPVGEPPVGEPPVGEIPIGELPGDGTGPGDGPVIDEPPADEIPPVEDVGGDPTGGDGVTIMPEPSEVPGDVGAAAEDRGATALGDHR